MPSRVEGRLKGDPADRRVFDGEVDDRADFMLVDATRDRWDQRHGQPDRREPVERQQLFRQQIRFAANVPVRLVVEAVELEIEGGARLVEFGE